MDFTKYLAMETAELLEDEYFRRWAHLSDSQGAAALADWLEHHPECHERFFAAREILLTLARPAATNAVPPSVRDADFDRFMLLAKPAKRPAVRRRLWPRIAAVAAILLLLIAGVWWWNSVESYEYLTGNGERKEILLPDGSEVTLNANSSLTWSENDWNDTVRTVNLNGEAFFTVTGARVAGQKKAFLVRTEDLTVRVLGTRFNVQSRRGVTEVFLEEGAVNVAWQNAALPPTNLQPGELLTHDGGSGQLQQQRPASAANLLAWRTGNLVFSGQPLEEALMDIGEIYGVKIIIPDADLRRRELASAGIPTDNLPLAIQLLERALGLKIEAGEENVYRVRAAE